MMLQPKREVRRIVPPEGVPLEFVVAPTGERLMAFLVDCLIIFLALLTVVLTTIATGTESILPAFGILAIFLLTNFYFIFFEMRGQGTTLGKRVLGIRVIDRFGGPLQGEAIFARNFLRQVEIFGPIYLLFVREAPFPGSPGLLRLLGVAWLIILGFMPLLNRDRLRVGDLVAGTLVVKSPKPVLLAKVRPHHQAQVQERRYHFTPQQLDVYGVYELQVLEEMLRGQRKDRAALEVVCDKIKRKIAWDRAQWDVEPLEFLTDFYMAQRAQLEAKMLLGERREFKKKGRLGSGS
ncbi:MAG: RDD family protein [Planctomycetota bacterium]